MLLLSEWWFFRTFGGLMPDDAARVAWGLPIALLVLALLLGAVWLWRHEHWTGTAAGYAALLCFGLLPEAEMFAPVIAWKLNVTHPDFSWVYLTYTKECIGTLIAFPVYHGLVWAAVRDDIRDGLARLGLS
jgi:hypothetical protein